MSKIIAIIGGPGTGKTSVINELKKRGYNTIDEAARQVIDEGLESGKTLDEIRGDVEKFQMAIVERKILNERSALNGQTEIVFVDRGMHDTWAYLKSEDIEIKHEVEDLLRSYKYYRVFLMEMLGNYDGEDYARTEDKELADEIHRLTEIAYQKYGMDVIKVPAVRVEDRVDHILRLISD